MPALELLFNITEENACPLYETGDEFKLSGNALAGPYGKPACLILTRDLTGRLAELKERNENLDKQKPLACSGCMGFIRLEAPRAKAAADTDPEHDIDAIALSLKKFSIFRTLDEHNIKELVSYLRVKTFTKDEAIIRKGDPGKNLYIIVSGTVEVMSDDGVSIAFLGKGEVFGEMSLLSGDRVGATIKVVEPAKVLYLNGKDFRKIINRFPSLQMYFARLLARRLAKTNIERSEELASGMVGKLSDMPPTEIFQALNANQKSGVLTLTLADGSGELTFKLGGLVKAVLNELEGEEAFFEALKQKEGRFKFTQGLTPQQEQLEEIGDFMWLLMQGLNKIDEESDPTGEDAEEDDFPGKGGGVSASETTDLADIDDIIDSQL